MTDELARKLREALELEEAERQRLAEEEDKRIREAEEAAKKETKKKSTGSKKPTMARKWRKLKQREKAEAEARVASPPLPMEPIEPVVPLPPRAKYVKPVFAENECYDLQHKFFLKGDWLHNNKIGIPLPSELAEAGFFFIGQEQGVGGGGQQRRVLSKRLLWGDFQTAASRIYMQLGDQATSFKSWYRTGLGEENIYWPKFPKKTKRLPASRYQYF